MVCDVIIHKKKDKYVARIKDWQEISVEENSRDEALAQVKSKFIDFLTNHVELVQIEIPFPSQVTNPWIEKFGWFKSDPAFDDLQSEIASYRKEIEEQMGQSSK